jgi:hypothetical protein
VLHSRILACYPALRASSTYWSLLAALWISVARYKRETSLVPSSSSSYTHNSLSWISYGAAWSLEGMPSQIPDIFCPTILVHNAFEMKFNMKSHDSYFSYSGILRAHVTCQRRLTDIKRWRESSLQRLPCHANEPPCT